MPEPKFLFVDDSVGITDDAQRFQVLLSTEGELRIELSKPNRDQLLISEAELADIDGFILDINLKDHAEEGQPRFLGTGAGLAQDIRALQVEGPPHGQRPRPIVRLCAAQVFQRYMEGDATLDDVFDLGFDKETVADVAVSARREIASLPALYQRVVGVSGHPDRAASLLDLEDGAYAELAPSFRTALETAICRRVHEAARFLLTDLLKPQGLLIDEATLAVRLGVDRASSPGWAMVKQAFEEAAYTGAGANGFTRWWSGALLTRWKSLTQTAAPLYRLEASARVEALAENGFGQLVPIAEDPKSPGMRPWSISVADDPELRVPVDPSHAYPLTLPVAPWLDEPVWCLEQARRNRRSRFLSEETKERLSHDLRRIAKARA
jgi:hypothetical protein